MTKGEMLARSKRILLSISALRADAAHWNSINPDEEPIEVDPDGALAKLETKLTAFIRDNP